MAEGPAGRMCGCGGVHDHGLVRAGDDGIREAEDGTTLIDVRVLPPGAKHPAIFALHDRLARGESFVLLNDHDPRPLRSRFQAQRPGAFTWEYLDEGPVEWRVRIGRP